jgi:hypothetical protein
MRLTLSYDQKPNVVPIREMKSNTLGIVDSGQFAGEIIYRDVSGWHSLTEGRWWPAVPYNGTGSDYVPDMPIRLLKDGDCLTVEMK